MARRRACEQQTDTKYNLQLPQSLGAPRACEQFLRILRVDRLGLAEVSEADQGGRHAAALRVLDDGEEVAAARLVVLHLSRVEVQVPKDRDGELALLW